MVKQENGKKTRSRLIDAACELFARKGYRDTKVADICRQAHANVASVNYYFRDKAGLYAEAWRYAFKRFEESFLQKSTGGSPEEQLRDYVYTLVHHFAEQGAMDHFSRLYLMELVSPSGLIPDAWHEMIEPRRQKMHKIIRELMAKKADDEMVRFCELSIINQCRTLVTINPVDLEYLLGESLCPELIERLADHIIKFSLAGIRAVGGAKK